MVVDLRLLATRVAKGDTAAYRQIVEHTQPKLYRLAAHLMGNLADGEDALQEAYVKAFKAMRAGRYDGRAKVTTWLYRIVTNSCIDAKRKRREKPQDARHEPRFDGHVSAEGRLALRELEEMLADLPEAQRAALVLTELEGMSAREAATVLDCSESAVEQRVARARNSLKARRDAMENRKP